MEGKQLKPNTPGRRVCILNRAAVYLNGLC
jgi:hypothetical protein